jgi:hypothetical protein
VVAQEPWIPAVPWAQGVLEIPVALMVLFGDAEGQQLEEAYYLYTWTMAQLQTVRSVVRLWVPFHYA